MGEPRADKVAVVTEVKGKLDAADGVLLTDYRGLDVPSIAELRKNLAPAGGEYKIYKNTLVKLAANELGLELDELLVGPTALAFIGEKADGSAGDAAAVAKALRDYAKTNDSLILKGGILDGNPLTVDEIKALADLPSRDVLFSEFAGAMESMFQDFAGGLDNKLREFVYAMQELVDKGGPGGAGAAPAEASADEEAVAEASADEEAVADASADEASAAVEAPADGDEVAATTESEEE